MGSVVALKPSPGRTREPRYRPIADYALVGDTQTAALVSHDGSIDWACFPRFDSPAVFCKLLDAERGGSFRVRPCGTYQSTRRYLGATTVLGTTFTTASGRAQLLDLMPVEPPPVHPRGRHGSEHHLLRLLEGISGQVEFEVSFRPTFDFARAHTLLDPCEGGAIARAGSESIALACPAPMHPGPDGALVARLSLRAGERVWLLMSYALEAEHVVPVVRPAEFDLFLRETLAFWERWSSACTYEGPYRDLVVRSALTLKMLTYEPTGALVAAPTTSLPESIGGVRNWDYRFTWLRDASLILHGLHLVGHDEAADRFFEWLERLHLERDRLQIMYTIDGGRLGPERTLDHLEGYRGSHPVRLSNAAAHQRQLDVYGHILDAALVCHARLRPVQAELWALLEHLANDAAALWKKPDQGLWEIRGGPRHFLYSKLQCWVALDRAVTLAARAGLPGPVDHWRRTRDTIRRAILTHGYDRETGAFTQAFGVRDLDASALVMPLVGFLPAQHPWMLSTIDRISKHLTSDGLVHRYLNADGLPGGEGAFAMCSLWLVDNLALAGRVDEAWRLFERIAAFGNDLALFSEEVDPVNHELLGNFPQGFTHLALIRSARYLARAERGVPMDWEVEEENP
jgi:GH15 family glucan-1,4-alpha-glucosidase